MDGTRFELVTFRTSSECSKPAELTIHFYRIKPTACPTNPLPRGSRKLTARLSIGTKLAYPKMIGELY